MATQVEIIRLRIYRRSVALLHRWCFFIKRQHSGSTGSCMISQLKRHWYLNLSFDFIALFLHFVYFYFVCHLFYIMLRPTHSRNICIAHLWCGWLPLDCYWSHRFKLEFFGSSFFFLIIWARKLSMHFKTISEWNVDRLSRHNSLFVSSILDVQLLKFTSHWIYSGRFRILNPSWDLFENTVRLLCHCPQDKYL